ncbi:hypothetical protein HN51_045674 [Arachis hypogaea]|uniref:uncharacterized protein LOC107613191 isoform X5 n=1 Tax=Arachis ipaensis TaxID=130454 RepID=UPI0007AF6248|nr:uncharacterized protein LOC107613191 isoform X5 [Arachis ipaensis]XP_025672990.1 uncharacterized protein LOC112772292 isoform X6 [Arachis hypogaea]
MQLCRYLPSWLCEFLACMGGCLGHFTKMPAILLVDEASVGLIPHDQAARKDSRSEDFWSSSTIDIEYALRSQRSASSIGISFDPQNSAALANDHPEFVNHGLILWNQMRRHWVGNLRQQRRKQVGEPRLSWNATYENLLGTDKPFPQRIPLGEMVDFLTDIWELEGLYD